jgi:energy-coupling factor transport system permease protein
MSVAPDFYIAGRSWLHVADPRVKLLLVGLVVMFLLVFQNLWVLLVAWLIILIVHRSAKVTKDRILFLLRALLPVSILMPLIWVVFYPAGDFIFRIGFFNIHGESLAQGLTVALRIQAMTFAIFALLFTTDTDTLMQGLVRLKMPYSWGLMLSLALRYVPNFANSYSSIRQAQQARGLEYESSRGLKRVREMMPVLVPMIIGSFRSSEQMAIALEARGFDAPGVQRTYLHVIRMRARDWALVAFGILATLALLALNIAYGFGAAPISIFLRQ